MFTFFNGQGEQIMSIDAQGQTTIQGLAIRANLADTRDPYGRDLKGRTTRAAANILAWRSYLPQDCVDTMIKMGWDSTV
jgi:hypothetical protein